MADWQPLVFSLVVAVLLGAIALVLKRRRARLAAETALADANHQRWEFALQRQDELGRLIDDHGLSADALLRASEDVLARMQSANDTGELDALIADNRVVVRETIETRRRLDGA
jgi:hypothetical protein